MSLRLYRVNFLLKSLNSKNKIRLNWNCPNFLILLFRFCFFHFDSRVCCGVDVLCVECPFQRIIDLIIICSSIKLSTILLMGGELYNTQAKQHQKKQRRIESNYWNTNSLNWMKSGQCHLFRNEMPYIHKHYISVW